MNDKLYYERKRKLEPKKKEIDIRDTKMYIAEIFSLFLFFSFFLALIFTLLFNYGVMK